MPELRQRSPRLALAPARSAKERFRSSMRWTRFWYAVARRPPLVVLDDLHRRSASLLSPFSVRYLHAAPPSRRHVLGEAEARLAPGSARRSRRVRARPGPALRRSIGASRIVRGGKRPAPRERRSSKAIPSAHRGETLFLARACSSANVAARSRGGPRGRRARPRCTPIVRRALERRPSWGAQFGLEPLAALTERRCST